MGWFKKSAASEPLAVAMSGVKLGDRLLVVGCSDPALIAALAIKAGLTGRACAVDASPALLQKTAAAVERDGALVETSVASFPTLPFDASAFDVVVLRDVLAAESSRPQSAVGEVLRVLRPGGRCIVIDTARGGLSGMLGGRSGGATYASGGAADVLQAGGFVAVRLLAERGGLTFAEGVKRNE